MVKISCIGAGNLGSAIAYEIASRKIANEIVLIDILNDLAAGQAADIQQALPFKNKIKIYSGDYPALRNSDIIIITAGKPRTPEMNDRLQLAEINVQIVGSIIQEIKKHSPQSIIITLTNPMDVLNYFIQQQGFRREKVIGSGGQLDSSRLRIVLGHPEQQVEAYVLGEHGEDQVPILSRVKIDGKVQSFSSVQRAEIKQKMREAALTVIQKKGATIFAPASNTADMVEAIIKDSKKVLACSMALEGEYGVQDISLGVPVVLGKNGVEKIERWDIDDEEASQLQEAGRKLKRLYQTVIQQP